MEGIKLARKNPPDIIALNISSTITFGDAVMDEWITLTELKKDPALAKIPTIILSHQDPQENFGFVIKDIDFLLKPFDIRLLTEKVKRLSPDETPSFLIVDDDSDARALLVNMVKSKGWEYAEAENGRTAIAALEQHIPSIILLDLMMPEMDGFTFIDELQKNKLWQNIPIIISSAKNLSPNERVMLAKYTQGVLQKGAYLHKDLITLISEHLK
jgi:CheY-like chemotaxis protein